ncbi:MAG: hypothetical protein IPI49_19635 [Myxococcales bacterium]|nr:hypothetical protein [Myxococcales bacterium]
MSGARSRRKGATWERELVALFRQAMPDAGAKRGLQFRQGQEAPDVDVPHFWVEAKHHHRTNIRAAMRQAIDAAGEGRWPVAVCKDDHATPLVTMRLDDFLALVGQWWQRRTP